eukprot:XP_001701349.1 predicted protein [Chlamydomonas reinhardtii]
MILRTMRAQNNDCGRDQGAAVGPDGAGFQATNAGCALLLDVPRRELYCAACGDFVYCPHFDSGRQLAHVVGAYLGRGLAPALPPHDPAHDVRSKRARAAADTGLSALRQQLAAAAAVFLHSPLLRNYFLGAGHCPAACSRQQQQQQAAAGRSGGGGGGSSRRPCLSCEMRASVDRD